MIGFWKEWYQQESKEKYYQDLLSFITDEYANKNIFPSRDELFSALSLTPYEEVKVVIIGQDPYYNIGQANGLAFSVHKDIAIPKSLQNMYKELESDLGIINTHGDLTNWATQGVLLLNTCLSVEEGKPLSHQNKGWEIFTDKIISLLGERETPIIFILWGKKAQMKKSKIQKQHYVLESAHPSPLSVYRGFWGSKPFSKTNEILISLNEQPIDWKV